LTSAKQNPATIQAIQVAVNVHSRSAPKIAAAIQSPKAAKPANGLKIASKNSVFFISVYILAIYLKADKYLDNFCPFFSA
jgi:hypothetical protein